jgi:hypothetical protein
VLEVRRRSTRAPEARKAYALSRAQLPSRNAPSS